jgi:predicted nucleic acid-binding protein
MASYLVDSSALLDIFTADPVWAEWSIRELEKAWADGTVFIDPIVYSEISIRFSRIEDLEAALGDSGLIWAEIPREALFLAGKAFLSYRKTGGAKASPLPDFFIGAHAAVADLVLITRDPDRMHKYFPKLRMISPNA